MEKKKGGLLRSTSWAVWLVTFITGLMMGLQVFTDYALPHEIMAWGFAFVASGYAGTDRIAQFVRTSTLEYGEADMGDPKKLKWVIWVSLILLAEALALTVFLGVPGLALDAFVVGFTGASGAFVVGNKAIKAAASTSGTHKATEQNRFHSEEDGYTPDVRVMEEAESGQPTEPGPEDF